MELTVRRKMVKNLAVTDSRKKVNRNKKKIMVTAME